MLARNYMERESQWPDYVMQVHPYGLTGTVKIVPYVDEPIA